MRKICVINQKGGVGKTTTTANVAYGLAEMGRKVLIIDLDPQGNIGKYFGLEEEQPDIYDILIKGTEIHDCIQQVTTNLSVICGKETLTKAEMILVGEASRETIMQRKLMALDGYDYVFIDCAPSLGLLNQNAMLFANEAFVPVSTDYLGLEGLKKIMAAISTVNKVFSHNLEITRVIPTMYDARVKHCKQSLANIQDEFYEAVTDPIRMNSKLKEAPELNKAIFLHAKSSNGAKDYQAVIKQVIQQETSSVVAEEEEEFNPSAMQGGTVVMTF